MIIGLTTALLAAAADPADAKAPGAPRAVIVNGKALEPAKLEELQRLGLRVLPGRYWYDQRSGAWGFEGYGTAGLIFPGLELGGPLDPRASNGTTRVFINGRELHATDVAGFQAMGIPVMPGRYWVDGYGNCGAEGGPMLFNLWVLAKQAQAGGASGGGAWSHTNRHADGSNSYVGGDGKGFMYFSSKNGSVFVGD